MKATDYIVEFLVNNGVKTVFGYQGGNIAHLIDSISKNDDIEFVTTYNEQSAAYAACSYALSTDNIGVALASSGPGAINLISGIANAYYDSIPTIFFTGNVSATTLRPSDKIRQNAFQENDIVTMVKGITKYAVTILNPVDLIFHLNKAIDIAKNGRPGPVLIDIPHNVQKTDIVIKSNDIKKLTNPVPSLSVEIDNIKRIIANCHKPLIIAGGGLAKNTSRELLRQLLVKWQIPVVSTLRGLDVINHNSQLFAGFGGAYGNRYANLALLHCDMMLVLGSRLDERFIAISNKEPFKNKTIIHIDLDSNELTRIMAHETAINCDLNIFLKSLITDIQDKLIFTKWIDTINNWKTRYSSVVESNSSNKIINLIGNYCTRDTIFTADVGINQMSVAQSVAITNEQKFLTSAGLGAMGCSLPLAIGVAFATNRKKVVNCFTGDGGLHMNIQELLVLKRDNLPIHVVLLNNKNLGMIRDYQTKAFNSNFAATVEEFKNIDYKALANAYKLPYFSISTISDLKKIKEQLVSLKPLFIEINLPEDVNTMPQLGRDMFTELPPLDESENILIKQEVSICENTIY